MTIKIGINGLGRIGRMIIRSLVESKNNNIEIKHINNRTNSETSSLLLKYDSVHGKFNSNINYNKNSKNLGHAKNFLKSVSMAKGDYVWPLGNDDLLLPNTLKKLYEIIQLNNDVDFFFVIFLPVKPKCLYTSL